MASFSFDYLVTVFLPGALLTFASGIALNTFDPCSAKIAWDLAANHQWLAVMVVTLASAFFGIFLSSLWGWIENHLADPRRAKKLGVTIAGYNEEWHLYVDSLNEGQGNSYISRVVLLWQFESRTALALILLAFAAFAAAASTVAIIFSLILGVMGVVLYAAGERHHAELATIRHRWYWEKASKAPGVADVRNCVHVRWDRRNRRVEMFGLFLLRAGAKVLGTKIHWTSRCSGR